MAQTVNLIETNTSANEAMRNYTLNKIPKPNQTKQSNFARTEITRGRQLLADARINGLAGVEQAGTGMDWQTNGTQKF